ncbi:TetR/AcrR family transcriptional regulator, partial [Nocardioides sp. GCM10030258]
FQREVVRLAGQESMAKGADLRQTYFTRFRDVIQSGIDSGQFREVDPTVDALLLFGSAQWAWTWFHPDGERPIEAICSAFVDLALGSLLINRRRLPQLSDAQGKAARTVRAAIAAVAEDAASTVA